jgi:putative Mn2+ efflux pump MntP
MNFLSILLIATGLAMDAFAVSITSGITIRHLRIKHALKIALFFGFFQAIMPIIGWLSGISLRNIISGFDHWIAFGLLSIIGCKMIYESFKLKLNEEKIDSQNIYILFILSIATSIDALAVGLSLSFLKVAIILPAIIIGVVTFLLSFFGVYVGNKVGHFFERKIEMIAGLVLIGIGIKILVEHLFVP